MQINTPFSNFVSGVTKIFGQTPRPAQKPNLVSRLNTNRQTTQSQLDQLK